MATFKRCPPEIIDLCNELLVEYETHKPLLDAKVKIDLVFAYPEYDEKTGDPIGDALKHHGIKALGITRKIGLKDRAKGHGDAEICLDGEWWKDASYKEKAALLDHELHHISVKIDKRGIVRDDIGRPAIALRKHDFQIGWFKIIAERHGEFSQERMQAKSAMDNMGQYFWPSLAK